METRCNVFFQSGAFVSFFFLFPPPPPSFFLSLFLFFFFFLFLSRMDLFHRFFYPPPPAVVLCHIAVCASKKINARECVCTRDTGACYVCRETALAFEIPATVQTLE